MEMTFPDSVLRFFFLFFFLRIFFKALLRWKTRAENTI